MHTIERYHDISAGHRVHGHESKCRHLHGHNYRIFFTVAPALVGMLSTEQEAIIPFKTANLDGLGRVIDFSVVKSTLCEWLEQNWDHKFLIWDHDPLSRYLLDLGDVGIVLVPFNPTAEAMAQYLVEVVGPALLDGKGVVLISCRVEETRKCSATYSGGVNFFGRLEAGESDPRD